jgi:hypothetical protein
LRLLLAYVPAAAVLIDGVAAILVLRFYYFVFPTFVSYYTEFLADRVVLALVMLSLNVMAIGLWPAHRHRLRQTMAAADAVIGAIVLAVAIVTYDGLALCAAALAAINLIALVTAPVRGQAMLVKGDLERRCPECQYDLTGNVSGICPECGVDTSAARRR